MTSSIRIFFRLAFALTWGIGGIGLLTGLWRPGSQPFSASSPLYYLAGYSVSLAGIALTTRYAGCKGLRRLGQRLIPWRSPAYWYLIVALGYAAITGIALQAAAFFQATAVSLPNWPVFFHGLFFAIVKDPGPEG